MDKIAPITGRVCNYILLLILIALISTNCTATPTTVTPEPDLPPFTLESPYHTTKYRYKAQTHVHSFTEQNPFDTGDTATSVEEAYRNQLYSVIFLTDHNLVTEDPGVGCDKETGLCILHISSTESGWACPHHLAVLGVKTPSLAEWDTDNTWSALVYGNKFIFDDCLLNPPCMIWWEECNDIQGRISKFTNDNALVVIAHPMIAGEMADPSWDFNEIDESQGFTGIEIWTNNGNSLQYWDKLNLGCHPKTWGFASDDCEDLQGDDFNTAWIVVNSDLGPLADFIGNQREDELREDILHNIRAGNFYSVIDNSDGDIGRWAQDLGPDVTINVTDNKIDVETDQSDSVIKFTNGIETYHTAIGSGSYTATGNEVYVRVEVKQIRHTVEYVTYSQPIFIVDRNPADQGVEGRIVVTTGASHSLKFCDNCGSCEYADVAPNGTFKIILRPGVYYFDAYDVNHEQSGLVTVGYSGFEFLQIDFELKDNTSEQ